MHTASSWRMVMKCTLHWTKTASSRQSRGDDVQLRGNRDGRQRGDQCSGREDVGLLDQLPDKWFFHCLAAPQGDSSYSVFAWCTWICGICTDRSTGPHEGLF